MSNYFSKLYDNEDTALVLIDGNSTFASSRAVNLDIDYALLKEHLEENAKILGPYYFTTLPDDPQSSVNHAIRPLLDWMDYNGYRIISSTKSDSNRKSHAKGNIDVALATKAMQLSPHYSTLILFSSEGDFMPLVEALQDIGKTIYIVAAKENSRILSDDLRRAADVFVPLENLRDIIKKRNVNGDEERLSMQNRMGAAA